MKGNIERPMDLLDQSKGQEILVYLKSGKVFSGELLAFDVHVNLALEDAKELENNQVKRKIGMTFVKGSNVNYVSPASTGDKE